MTDLEFLFAVMAAFYLWECTHWLPVSTVAFGSWVISPIFPSRMDTVNPAGRWRAGAVAARSTALPSGATGDLKSDDESVPSKIQQPAAGSRTGRGGRLRKPFLELNSREVGGVLASPMPGLGTFFIASQPALALSPRGVANETGAVARFSEPMRFEARQQRLTVNGTVLARVCSPAHARWLAAALNRLAGLPETQRESELSLWLAARLDSRRVAERLREFEQSARLPSLTAAGVFGVVFLVAPLLTGWCGLAQAWPWLLGGMLILCTANAWLLFRAHRKLYPERDDERFAHVVMALLFPPAAMRTRDMLSRPLLEAFHPLAVAKELCDGTTFEAMAGRVVRELRHPRVPRVRPAAGAAEVWNTFHQSLRAAVDDFLVRNGFQPDRLASLPTPSDPECRSYCPRCHAQFTRTEGTCSDCNVPLARFEADSQEPHPGR